MHNPSFNSKKFKGKRGRREKKEMLIELARQEEEGLTFHPLLLILHHHS